MSIIDDILRANAELRRTEPKAAHVWITRAITNSMNAARVDLPDRILFFVNRQGLAEIERRTGSYRPVSVLTLCGVPIRDFDAMPRDARLTLTLEIEAVSPGLAAMLALVP